MTCRKSLSPGRNETAADVVWPSPPPFNTNHTSTMAYTQEDLDAVRKAIATGEKSVSVNGRRVDYRDMAELIQAENRIAAYLAAPASAPRGGPRRFTFTTMRGD